MYETIKYTLMHISIDDLKYLNAQNDLRINEEELELFHKLLLSDWNEIIEETSLSIRTDILSSKMMAVNTSKYHELITTIKRNVIFKR